MKHVAELIAVGTEILLGNIANTDAQDLSQALSALGIDVYHHTVVGDNPDRLREALTLARSRADVIITTGGLGPTYDDLTKQTIAETFGRKLIYHEDLAEHIRGVFKNRGFGHMTDNNLLQAWLPEGCTVLHNSCGTAPGCAIEENGVHVLMLPGPPRECRAMIRTGVIPYLKALGGEEIYSKTVYIFGMGESAVEDRLHEEMTRLVNPTLAPYAKEGYCTLRITAKAKDDASAEAMIAPVLARVREALGDVIYGVDTGPMENALVKLLKERSLTLAAAESCTGGLIAKRVTDVPGASAVFPGGIVSYCDGVKHGILGVDDALLRERGAVSPEVAIAMAEGAARVTGADLAVSTTGVAGPDTDDRGNPVGLVYIGLYDRGKTLCRTLRAPGSREQVRNFAALSAMDTVRRAILGLPMRDRQ